MNDLLVLNIGRLVTNDAARPGLLGVVEGAGVAIVDGFVAWIGFEADVPDRYQELPRLDAGGGAVLPGFVDAVPVEDAVCGVRGGLDLGDEQSGSDGVGRAGRACEAKHGP